MRTAVCPHWNMISIDDIYSGSASGTRHFTMHVLLLGDVILVQPDAYQQVSVPACMMTLGQRHGDDLL